MTEKDSSPDLVVRVTRGSGEVSPRRNFRIAFVSAVMTIFTVGVMIFFKNASDESDRRFLERQQMREEQAEPEKSGQSSPGALDNGVVSPSLDPR